MPIGNKNENDGTTKDLNENLSGLTISDKKTQAPQQQPTSTNSSVTSVYVPPSMRKSQGGHNSYNNGGYNNNNNSRDNNNYNNNQGGYNKNYSREYNNNGGYNNNNNQGGFNKGGFDSPKQQQPQQQPQQQQQQPQQQQQQQPVEDYNNGNNNRNQGGYSNNGGYNNGGYNNNNYNNNGGGYYNKGYSNNGGYNSPSYNRNSSPFNNRGGGYRNAGGKIDGYYERWQKFKDSRHFPDMKREINFDVDEDQMDDSAKEIFKSKNPDQEQVGINFDSYDEDEISIETSENICSPLNGFTDIDLGDTVLHNIKMAKYTKPTPVQKSALPIIMKNRDLMACAQTGSGKTAAFLFPIISGILLDGAPEPPQQYKPGVPRAAHPRALVLAPTRELVQQIYKESLKFSYGSPVASVVIYGGAEVSNQINELERGCDILVATTGRLVDLLLRGRVALDKIKYLVLDEADRMLDMGFEPQIRQIICDFDMNKNEGRQTLMFSATFPRPIQNLASDFLNNYVFLKVGVVGTTQNITQRIEYVHEDEKNSYLLDYLSNMKSDGLTLIFVETKRSCDTLTYFLNQRNFPAICIHGDLSQNERENALQSFRSFQTPFLVATDIASRGLHITNVNYVINYDLPNDIHVYVHRIGRTGRAGKKGFAISFYNEKNKPIASELSKLLKQSNQDCPDWFERTVHSYKNQKMPGSNQKSKGSYDSPFQKSYHNNNNNYNRFNNNNRSNNSNNDDNRSDARRHSNSNSNSNSNHDSNDYSMHSHHFNNNGGSYN